MTIAEWTVCFCAGCKLGRTDPRPTIASMKQMYDSGYFLSGGPDWLTRKGKVQRKIARMRSRVRFLLRFRSGGRLLDVGCGEGIFLAAAERAGFDVEGIEMASWAVRRSRELFRFPMTQSSIMEFTPPSRAYDIVTLWHVLEHLHHPLSALQRIRDWLHPKGLLILEVPNHEGTDAQRWGKRWDGWTLPHHLYHFTPATLTEVLKQAGFSPVALDFDRSSWVRKMTRYVPIINLLGMVVSRFYTGKSVRVVSQIDVRV